jgi:hypothetical protein
MTKRQRKSLDDSLASEFVFGGDKPQTGVAPTPDIKPEPEEVTAESQQTFIAPMSEQPVENKNKELSLMEKLQLEPKEATKRFTIDLEESLHRDLSILAAQTGRTKADIVRMLLRDAISSLKK